MVPVGLSAAAGVGAKVKILFNASSKGKGSGGRREESGRRQQAALAESPAGLVLGISFVHHVKSRPRSHVHLVSFCRGGGERLSCRPLRKSRVCPGEAGTI